MAKHAVNVLNYASPSLPRDADRRKMFVYLVPDAICLATLLGSLLIRTYGQDSRDSGPCCILFMAPFALICGIAAIREAFRLNGLQALVWGLAWNLPLVLGPWLILLVIVRFGLFKHGY